jgi:phosphatidylserine decarboxylase
MIISCVCRWHMPVSGTILRQTLIDGHYFTVNPIAVTSESFDVFTQNKRVVCEVWAVLTNRAPLCPCSIDH